MKTCVRCLCEYPATTEYFYRYKATKDGLQSYCKKCSRARVRQWAKDHPDKVRENNARYHPHSLKANDVPDGMKRCCRCSVLFPKTNRRPKSYCPKCQNQVSREWRQKNPDRAHELQKRSVKKNGHKRTANGIARAKERTREWYKRTYRDKRTAYLKNAQERRVRKRGLPCDFTASDWRRCLDYFNHRCAVCGRPAGLWHRLAQDHWIPVTDPRPDNPGSVPSNIVPLCHGVGGCNNNKQNKDPLMWLRSQLGDKRANLVLARIEAYFCLVRST